MPKKKSDNDLMRERNKALGEAKGKEGLLENSLITITDLREQLKITTNKLTNTAVDLELLKKDAQEMRVYIAKRDEEFRYGRAENLKLFQELELLKGKRISFRYYAKKMASYLWMHSKEFILNLWNKTKEFIAR